MDNDRSIQSNRMASLAQVGLAALVAGTLLAFSALAFNAAFDDEGRTNGVSARPPVTRLVTPVVLPDTSATDVKNVRLKPNGDDQVLGTQISRSTTADLSTPVATQPAVRRDATGKHATKTKEKNKGHRVGKGHLKARGKGHHKHEGDDWDGVRLARADEEWTAERSPSNKHGKASRGNGSKKR